MAAMKKILSSNKQNPITDAVKAGAKANNRRRTSTGTGKRKNQQLQQQFLSEKDYRLRLQEVLFTPEQICQKIFRKDGPPLGVEFDCVPARVFRDHQKSHNTFQERQRPLKRQKVSTLSLDYQAFTERSAFKKKDGIGKGFMTKNVSIVKEHGLGKGLMTRTGSSMKKHGVGKDLMTNNGSKIKKYGIGKGLMTKRSSPIKRHGIGKGLMTVWKTTYPGGGDFSIGVATPTSIDISPPEKSRLPRKQSLVSKLKKKAEAKRNPSQRLRKVGGQKIVKQNQSRKGKCELAHEVERCREDLDRFAMLIDDEELELRELQAGPNSLTCCHLLTNELHGCSLCKDLLPKFPPDSVSMKLPLYAQPWDSSPQLVKKLFKAFHFICTYSVLIDTSSFTLGEFAQAFLEKESLLLGQVHLSLLKVLFSDIFVEMDRGYFTHAGKNSKFMELLYTIKDKRYLLESWHKSLTAMTWTEILRQVFLAAGFRYKFGKIPRNTFNKEVNIMAKYGLRPGTLKGELFSALLTKGNIGMKVSELSKLSSISELNLVDTAKEMECVVNSTLSSDITLFEKISSAAYRLRVNASMESESCISDPEGLGSVDNDSEIGAGFSSGGEYEPELCDSSSELRLKKQQENDDTTKLTIYNEIDESNPGEVWLLGLMEGEYSDLSIEEKLNALLALVDLLNSGSSFRQENPAVVSTSVLDAVDSLAPLIKISKSGKAPNKATFTKDLHSLQSIFLGSDRRYNRYWLFLGPCDGLDPGHRRIYFESSEDGNWAVLDTQEALCSLLSSLDRRGAREAFLLSSLEKRESYLCGVMSDLLNDGEIRRLTHSDQSELNMSREDSSSAVSDVDNNLCVVDMQTSFHSNDIVYKERKIEQPRDKWNRAQAFDKWIWESFYSGLNAVKCRKGSFFDSLTRCVLCHDLYWRDEKHCKVCHTTFELDFDLEEKYAVHAATCRGEKDTDKFPKHKVLCSQLQLLKAAVHAIESVMPEEAMSFTWAKSAHHLWVKRLRRASTLMEFIQVVADFVSAINEDYFYTSNSSLEANKVLEEILSRFPALYQSSSAIALWLVKLDALVAPHLEKERS